MPVMESIKLLKYINKNYFGMKVILLSAFDNFDNMKTDLLMGAYALLIKPFKLKQLKKIIEQIELDLRLKPQH